MLPKSSEILHTKDCSLVNLCIILILGHITSQLSKHAPSTFERNTYFIAWLLSTVVNVLQFGRFIPDDVSPLVIGVIVILAVIFVSQIIQVICRYRKRTN